ncbi:F-box only protein 38-like, partial [Seriola lalandi dorsalis]
MEAEPQIELEGAEGAVRVEEADGAPGASRPAGTPQPPDEEQAGPSGLVQQCRPANAIVPKPPLVISDSDSEEEEGLVSRLMPASCLQEPASCTEGKGKTPLRRSNNVSVEQTKAQVSDSSCEKSCQVTSEQIKADMKAAGDTSRRTSSKGITTEAGETAGQTARADSGTVQGTGSAGAAVRTGVRPVTGSLVRTGPGAATSRQVGGCGRVVAGTSHRTTTTADRATGTGRTNDGTEGPSGAQAGDSYTGEAGGRLNCSPAGVDGLEPRGAAVNHGPRRPALQSGQGERHPGPATGSGSQHGQARNEDFVPRRPLTRSRTRMSAVSLVPDT